MLLLVMSSPSLLFSKTVEGQDGTWNSCERRRRKLTLSMQEAAAAVHALPGGWRCPLEEDWRTGHVHCGWVGRDGWVGGGDPSGLVDRAHALPGGWVGGWVGVTPQD